MTDFSETARKIVGERYAKSGESLEDVFHRVALGLAQPEYKYLTDSDLDKDTRDKHVERWADTFYSQMINKKLIPAGRTLANAGGDSDVVANCVVLPVEDSMNSIGGTMHKAMLLQQQGCGLGFDFSKLRPAGFVTKKSQGIASGPVSFMKIYDNAFSVIKQQSRHGANMGMLRIDHPDILDFISCKEKEGDINNFNISVLVTEKFMQQLENDPDGQWLGLFKDKPHKLREVNHVKNMFGNDEVVEEIDISVVEVWDRLCKAAHRNGEPGIAFIDTVNKHNPLPGLGDITSSNPCGEQFLHPYDNCNLLSINIAAFEQEDTTYGIDWKDLGYTVDVAVRMLDNTVDLFKHNVEEINKMAVANRRIGLGIMGFADLLFKRGVRYGSDQSAQMAKDIMEFINSKAYQTSVELGRNRGSFPNWSQSIYAERGDNYESNIRNAARTSIAPTGSISMIFDVNSGIEPYFSLAYVKKVRLGDFTYTSYDLVDALEKAEYSEREIDEITEMLSNGVSLKEISEKSSYKIMPDHILTTFVTSMEVDPIDHVKIQAAFQKNTDNSISKTINLPNNADVLDVGSVYAKAWRAGCKSVTVYRDGSRQHQVLNVGTEEKQDEKEEEQNEHSFHGVIERPDVVVGETHTIQTAHGNMYVTVNMWEHNGKMSPYEVFAYVGKEGGCSHTYMSAVTRIISRALRSGMPISDIAKQYRGITCHTAWHNGVRNEGPIDALAQVMERYVGANPIAVFSKPGKYIYNVGEVDKVVVSGIRETGYDICPDCNATSVVIQEGCATCVACGWSKC